MAYYVIEIEKVDSSYGSHVDATRWEVRTEAARGNSGDHPVIIDGWCGTTGGWAVFAHGEYETQEAAEAYIREQLGDCRDIDLRDLHSMDLYEDGVVAVYKPGKYEPLCAEVTANMIWDSVERDVTADMTDADLEEMADAYAAELRANLQAEPDRKEMFKIMGKRRDELLAEREEAARP